MEVMKIGHDLNALNHVIIILKFRKKEGKISWSSEGPHHCTRRKAG